MLLLGQALVIVHASDADDHSDGVTCDLCHIAFNLSGALPSATPAFSLNATPTPVPASELATLDFDARSLLPLSRAPPAASMSLS